MTPHQQLIKHDPANNRYGDCYRTCIAVILDLHPSLVPHFNDWSHKGPNYQPTVDDDRARDHAVKAWLQARGLVLFNVVYDCDIDVVLQQQAYLNEGAPYILSGQSRLGVNHSVVAIGGEIVCDPSGNGIIGPCSHGFYWIEIVSRAARRFA